ncbi:MAG: SufD family Fe-S cluster assembly protein [Roseiarcus sp.]|jgi:Fe-S cluster assembly protein SufD|uniref:SufB/SufD family protein n=1 Tax=Roseiarcus sp. TaxID=1969460 RepID=UPI003C21A255
MTAAPVIARTAAELGLAEQFRASPGAAASPARAAAFRRFEAAGLPTRRVESWHYTDLRVALAKAAPLAAPPDEAAIAAAKDRLAKLPRLAPVRLVLVNGVFVAALSDRPPVGVALAQPPASPAISSDDPMLALALALAPAGVAATVAPGAKPPPIEIIHCFVGEGPRAVYSRLAIEIGADASAAFVERFVGAGAESQRHASTSIDVAAGGALAHVAAIEDEPGLHVESEVVRLAERAALDAFGFVGGGALARRQIFARLVGEGARIGLAGLGLLDGRRHADTTLEVVHAAPRGESREFYRHIVADEATGVFQGKVIVQPGAQKTDGAMKSQAILLSPDATMNAKPELEIFADDVVCGHGATIGALDPEQLFYLQARGLPPAEAEAMLLEAFGAEAISRVADAELAEALLTLMRDWLARRGRGRRS